VAFAFLDSLAIEGLELPVGTNLVPSVADHSPDVVPSFDDPWWLCWLPRPVVLRAQPVCLVDLSLIACLR
jgi:hypothetical protein